MNFTLYIFIKLIMFLVSNIIKSNQEDKHLTFLLDTFGLSKN